MGYSPIMKWDDTKWKNIVKKMQENCFKTNRLLLPSFVCRLLRVKMGKVWRRSFVWRSHIWFKKKDARTLINYTNCEVDVGADQEKNREGCDLCVYRDRTSTNLSSGLLVMDLYSYRKEMFSETHNSGGPCPHSLCPGSAPRRIVF